MSPKTILKVPIWPHWLLTLLATALFVEYLRLVLTTQAPTYRLVLVVVLGIALAASLARLVLVARRQAGAGDADRS